MKVLKRILIALVTIVVILVVIGFLLPKTRHVERSVVIDATPCAVFAQVNGFRNFNDWSPFVAVSPDADYAYDGPDFGVGSKITWNIPDPEPETGRQTIIASAPYERVDIELDLGRGGNAQVAYLLQPENGGTHLTWSFDTDFGINLVGRYFGLILDRQLGPLYAQGLANLKRIDEQLPKVDWSAIDIGITEVSSTTIAYSTGESSRELRGHFFAAIPVHARVAVFVSANGLQIDGQPVAINNYWDDRGYGFDAGLPVSGTPTRGAGPGSAVRMGETYGGRVVRAVHVGPYNGLENTYSKAEAFMTAHRLESNGRSWDIFVSDPGNTAEDELVTEIYHPVK